MMRRFLFGLALLALPSCMGHAAPKGYLASALPDTRQQTRSCWYCGDYTGPVLGTSTLPSPQRICGYGPRWSGSCPATTTLDDGSSWSFSAGCRCDG